MSGSDDNMEDEMDSTNPEPEAEVTPEPEPETPDEGVKEEGQPAPEPDPEPEKPKRRGRKPKPTFEDPSIGRIVLYVTRTGTVRPAIVTAVEGTVVDLTVFNSQGAVPATGVLADPEVGTRHSWHWPSD